ncbi:MAG TPA: hypothetical protein VHU80_08785 [Polyangiaceae bacterium]|jgi:hypothetical protein|nr:hypothetical protein [Polyangiaceae bacterium]
MRDIADGIPCKHRYILFIGVAASTLSMACGGTSGDQADTPATAPRSAIDGEMLNAALDEQTSLETAGFELSSRYWLSADAYVAEYHTEAGGIFATQRIGRVSLVGIPDLPKLEEGKKLVDFAERARDAGELPVAEMPKDRLWFVPPFETADGIGTTSAASTLDDVAKAIVACQAKATSSAKETVGYELFGAGDPFDVFDWSYVQNPGFSSEKDSTNTTAPRSIRPATTSWN